MRPYKHFKMSFIKMHLWFSGKASGVRGMLCKFESMFALLFFFNVFLPNFFFVFIKNFFTSFFALFLVVFIDFFI